MTRTKGCRARKIDACALSSHHLPTITRMLQSIWNREKATIGSNSLDLQREGFVADHRGATEALQNGRLSMRLPKSAQLSARHSFQLREPNQVAHSPHHSGPTCSELRNTSIASIKHSTAFVSWRSWAMRPRFCCPHATLFADACVFS